MFKIILVVPTPETVGDPGKEGFCALFKSFTCPLLPELQDFPAFQGTSSLSHFKLWYLSLYSPKGGWLGRKVGVEEVKEQLFLWNDLLGKGFLNIAWSFGFDWHLYLVVRILDWACWTVKPWISSINCTFSMEKSIWDPYMSVSGLWLPWLKDIWKKMLLSLQRDVMLWCWHSQVLTIESSWSISGPPIARASISSCISFTSL